MRRLVAQVSKPVSKPAVSSISESDGTQMASVLALACVKITRYA